MNELVVLLLTSLSIAFFHTLLGPDHYLPFIVMAKSGNWTKAKTIWVTIYCGLGHVFSSVILGLIGIASGAAISKLNVFESIRGEIAAWFLIAFGFVYFIWGIKKAYMNKPHRHIHYDENGNPDIHVHTHEGEHGHKYKVKKKNITPWILFTIFVLGPCEPLIPLLMYPAATHSNIGLLLVTCVFGITTILTMLTVVLVSIRGINFIPLGNLEKYSHVIAGASICLSGLAITIIGL